MPTMLLLYFFLLAVVSSRPGGTIGENVDGVIDELGRKITDSQVRPSTAHRKQIYVSRVSYMVICLFFYFIYYYFLFFFLVGGGRSSVLQVVLWACLAHL